MKRALQISVFGIGLFAALMAHADWLQFRGSDGTGVSANSTLPTNWSEDQNIAWRADLPGRGPSSPIVVKGRVYVTCSGGSNQDRLYVLCFDAKTGKESWRREFWATGRTLCHPSSAVAAPSPASDGERIFAFYSSNDLICLDLDGNLLWYRGLAVDYPKTGNDVGMASSPAVIDGTVVVQVECQGDSFAEGIDAKTGERRWRVKRDPRANWASPVAFRPTNGQGLVLLQSPSGLTAHDPRSGEEKWKYETDCPSVPTLVAADNRIYLPSNGITVLKLSADATAPELDWDSNRLNPSSSSPIIHDGKIYTLNSNVLNCGDAASGDKLWQVRLGGRFWATPVIAGKYMYTVNYDGDASVIDISGEKGEVVATNKFNESVQGTPAVDGNAMYVRSDGHLWKVAAE